MDGGVCVCVFLCLCVCRKRTDLNEWMDAIDSACVRFLIRDSLREFSQFSNKRFFFSKGEYLHVDEPQKIK